jgi:hypothetical protein
MACASRRSPPARLGRPRVRHRVPTRVDPRVPLESPRRRSRCLSSTHLVDAEGVALIREWIAAMPGDRF